MHIQVGEILAQEVGFQKVFKIADERPELEDVVLTEPVDGTVSVTRLGDGVGLTAQLSTAQQLECHRCLQEFTYPQTVKLSGEFNPKPEGEALPLERDNTIDIAPLLREELIITVPIKQLCEADCAGIDPKTGKPYKLIKKEEHGSTKKAKD